MILVDKKTFLAMPDGTIFSYWNETYGGDITNLYKKKFQPQDDDFCMQNLLFQVGSKYGPDGIDAQDGFVESLHKGNSEYNDFKYPERNGWFEDDKMFIVYDKIDIQNLIEQLTK